MGGWVDQRPFSVVFGRHAPPPQPPWVGLGFSWVLGLRGTENHLEERLLDQAQARTSYTPLFGGRSRSIPQCMISDVQLLVKSPF